MGNKVRFSLRTLWVNYINLYVWFLFPGKSPKNKATVSRWPVFALTMIKQKLTTTTIKKSGRDVMAYFILYFRNFISNWNFEFLVRITKYLAITSSGNKIRSFEFRAILRNGVSGKSEISNIIEISRSASLETNRNDIDVKIRLMQSFVAVSALY